MGFATLHPSYGLLAKVLLYQSLYIVYCHLSDLRSETLIRLILAICAGILLRMVISPFFLATLTAVAAKMHYYGQLNRIDLFGPGIAFVFLEFFLVGLVTGSIARRREAFVGLALVFLPWVILGFRAYAAAPTGNGFAAILHLAKLLKQQHWFMLWFPILPAIMGVLVGKKMAKALFANTNKDVISELREVSWNSAHMKRMRNDHTSRIILFSYFLPWLFSMLSIYLVSVFWMSLITCGAVALLLYLMWGTIARRFSLAWSFAYEAERLRTMRRMAVRETFRDRLLLVVRLSPFFAAFVITGHFSSIAFGGHNVGAVNASTAAGLTLLLYWMFDWTFFALRQKAASVPNQQA
jgi:hypothetical protein